MINNIQFYKMSTENLYDLIHFVIKENHVHHQEGLNPEDIDPVTEALYHEEKQYLNSHIFTAMSGNILCGSIRIFQKTPHIILPLESIFNINAESIAGEGASIYHIGRFAVSKGADKKGFRIFKTLIALALQVAQQDEDGIVFAECDVKLLRTIQLLGIEAEAIGEPILYLGSETVPIKLLWTGYQNFLNNNKNLFSSELQMFRQECPNTNHLHEYLPS